MGQPGEQGLNEHASPNTTAQIRRETADQHNGLISRKCNLQISSIDDEETSEKDITDEQPKEKEQQFEFLTQLIDSEMIVDKFRGGIMADGFYGVILRYLERGQMDFDLTV